MYIHIYIYIYRYTYLYIYIYIRVARRTVSRVTCNKHDSRHERSYIVLLLSLLLYSYYWSFVNICIAIKNGVGKTADVKLLAALSIHLHYDNANADTNTNTNANTNTNTNQYAYYYH